MRAKKIIHLSHIKKNLLQLSKHVSNEVKICASIKSNAYGHGLIPIAKYLINDVDYWGVATFDEATELVNNKLALYKGTPHVLFYSMLSKNEIEESIKLQNSLAKYSSIDTGFEYFVGSIEYLKEIIEYTHIYNTSINIHLKIDTGMGRVGVLPNQISDLFEIAFSSVNIKIVGICSHYSDSSNEQSVNSQRNQFVSSVRNIENDYLHTKENNKIIKHMANSGAIIWDSNNSSFDMIRPGIALYGSSPNPNKAELHTLDLLPGMTLQGSISAIKDVPKGYGISYNSTYKAIEDTQIAIVNLGYGDGLLRSLSNVGFVFLNDMYYPIVGTVCMDMCMIDLGFPHDVNMNRMEKNAILKFPAPRRGDMVEFFGLNITADFQASRIETISYELFCSVSMRVPTIYID